MPELPEVERAAKLTRHVAVGRTVTKVETFEDTIVYTGGITHSEFAKEITGRKVTGVGRYGKVFYIELDGEGRMPVLHLGMTGMIQVKGEEPTWYRRRNKDLAADVWPPPKFLKVCQPLLPVPTIITDAQPLKFIMHFSATDDLPATELAFIDARRLARIRLVRDPTKEPPISELGFDPILSMPEYDEFAKMVLKRTCPVKALLLDQSFSAGVGNWVADEILYQSRIHPEQRASNLSEEQLKATYNWTKRVCETAVAVNADSTQFPADWLFKYRWSKGQKSKEDMLLPNGEKAKIEWLTVGGRTSAVVTQVQKMPVGGRKVSKKASQANSDDEGEAGPSKPAPAKGRKRKASRKQGDAPAAENGGAEGVDESDLTPAESDGEDKVAAETVVVRRSSRFTAVEEQGNTVRAVKRQKTVVTIAEEPIKKNVRARKASRK
ncbi:hypothetical protein FRC09_007586 [Ceratobasidium sp. 395]|nr:hypothetical protein FRC09_007586 [Ceratobasidium sp. 395]